MFPEDASTYASDIDGLFWLITGIVGFWFILAEVALFYLIFRFRRKDGVKAQYIAGETKKEKNWITYPHIAVILCDVVLVIGAVMVWNKVKIFQPEPDYTIRAISQQWAWTFVHPGPDGALDTEDDIAVVDELHVKKDAIYHFLLESKDVVHSFSVPVFRLKQDAVPGRTITGWFQPTRTGTFDIQCAEICGIGHGLMVASLIIESEEDHQSWMAQHATQLTPAIATTDQPH